MGGTSSDALRRVANPARATKATATNSMATNPTPSGPDAVSIGTKGDQSVGGTNSIRSMGGVENGGTTTTVMIGTTTAKIPEENFAAYCVTNIASEPRRPNTITSRYPTIRPTQPTPTPTPPTPTKTDQPTKPTAPKPKPISVLNDKILEEIKTDIWSFEKIKLELTKLGHAGPSLLEPKGE